MAAAFCAASAHAGIGGIEIDLSGAESEGEFGDASNTVLTVDVDAGDRTVAGFGWLLSFEAFSPSWGAEARIDITSPAGTVFTFSGDDAGWATSPGVFVDGDDTDIFNGELASGEWEFRFYEDFDDASTDPDGIYRNATFLIKSVPAPGALALLGVAGLAARRRRRN